MTEPENAFKQILEEIGFTVKLFVDKTPDDFENIYMQVPVLSYNLDFACPKKKIAMEVDGEYWHGSASVSVTASQLQQKLHDAQRSKKLEENGWTIFRIPASCLSNNRMKPQLIKYVRYLFTTNH